MAEERAQYLVDGGRMDAEEDPVKVHGLKRVSALFLLPYWVVSSDLKLHSTKLYAVRVRQRHCLF